MRNSTTLFWSLFRLNKPLQFRIQLDNMKKELELSNDSYHKMKKTYEEQITSQMAKEKVGHSVLLILIFLSNCI